jgi:hypothetical protein
VQDDFVLVQPELERGRSPLVSIPPFGAEIFKASGSTDPMRIWNQRKEQVPALLFIVSMSPPGYPSAWLRPRRARFRFAQQDHCSSTTSISLNFRNTEILNITAVTADNAESLPNSRQAGNYPETGL